MIVFIPSILFVPFTCCYLCRRLCERDFNYALLLKDKREHPEKYAEDDEEDGDEDAVGSENDDDGNDEDNEPSDVDEEGFEE